MKKISDATVMVSDSSGARPSSFIWYEYSKVKAIFDVIGKQLFPVSHFTQSQSLSL